MTPDLAPVLELVSERIRNALVRSAESLEAGGIPYLLVGGLAVSAYAQPRATKDVDYVLDETGYVRHGGGVVTLHPAVPFEVEGIPVDSVSVRLPPGMLEEAFERAHETQGIQVAPVEFLVYLKLRAYRARDKADLDDLLEAGLDVGPTQMYLERFDPSMVGRFRLHLVDWQAKT